MLAIVGVLQAMQGLAALFNDDFYAVHKSGLVIHLDYTVWGWAHLLLGAIAILTGAGILAGKIVARVVGVVLAMVSAVVNLLFLPAYPLWSALVIAFDVLVIYALTAHGGEMKQRR